MGSTRHDVSHEQRTADPIPALALPLKGREFSCVGGTDESSHHSCAVLNVSHSFTLPVSNPRLNQRTRCCELPCVNDSGDT